VLANVVFAVVLVAVFGGLFAARIRWHRRFMRMTPEERDRIVLARGGSMTAPLVEWARRRLRRERR
jgi:hypothetical protein